MCGIIFAKSLDGKPVNKVIAEQFEDQKSRGQEGFGIVLQKLDKTLDILRATQPLKFLVDLQTSLNPSEMIMAHHRTPTSSPNLTGQTHPILVRNELLKYDYLIEHNGVIYNDDERKKDHETMGFTYSTEMLVGQMTKFNDSEALAIDIALWIEQLLEKVEARGNAAYCGLQIDKATGQAVKWFFGRNWGNPLHFFRDQKLIFLSSEGKGESVEDGTITFIDLTHPKLKQKIYKLEIPTYVRAAQTYNNSNRAPITIINGGQTEDSKSAASTNIEHRDDDYAYQEGGPHYDRVQTAAELAAAAAENDDEDMDSPLGTRIAEIESDLEDRIMAFIDALTDATNISQAGEHITEIVETMNGYLTEMEQTYQQENAVMTDAELQAQFDRSLAE